MMHVIYIWTLIFVYVCKKVRFTPTYLLSKLDQDNDTESPPQQLQYENKAKKQLQATNVVARSLFSGNGYT